MQKGGKLRFPPPTRSRGFQRLISMNKTLEKLQEKFSTVTLKSDTFREQTNITIPSEHLLDMGRFLRDEPDLNYNLLMDVYGIDRRNLGIEPRFATIYELFSIPHNTHLRLTVPVKKEAVDINSSSNDRGNGHSFGTGKTLPTIDSVTSLWSTANWLEREAYDLMGIRFEGHPWLHRIMMPDRWVGHPLRKDYPIGGEPVYFSHDKDNPKFDHLATQIMDGPSYHADLEADMDTEKHMVINMGPHHPSTHGVLRLAVELDGERVIAVRPEVGYLHSGFEKIGESKRYENFIPYCDRMDYASTMSNNLGYVMTIEKLMDVEVPQHAQYARVILTELQRIASHMLWLGTHAMDVSGMIHSLLMYCFYSREKIMDIFEMVCGARMTTSYFCVGGLRWALPGAFMPAVKHFVDEFKESIKDFEGMLTNNPIWKQRLIGIGHISRKEAIDLGLTGPMLRGSGVEFDLRKKQPYSSYDDFEFDIPTSTAGDSYGRYIVRMEELRQSIRIIEQAVEKIKPGMHKTDDRKVALPPRPEIMKQSDKASMESLIHHFKLVTEGYKPPAGHIYGMAENPKGILGFGIVSDGSAIPYRLRVRGPSFSQYLPKIIICGRMLFMLEIRSYWFGVRKLGSL
ncbi:MAG: hypothetical protein B6242_01200 [Anaerolineaceae bacterium 4572_78]|nr:MAG: hypothetical protein B6242_01200 [Anaerolineaceae bacterium 4572_78]